MQKISHSKFQIFLFTLALMALTLACTLTDSLICGWEGGNGLPVHMADQVHVSHPWLPITPPRRRKTMTILLKGVFNRRMTMA